MDKQVKILVIEDSEFMNTLICATLQDAGFRTVSAFDGQQGMRLAVSEKPDLILMDLMMPVMDGIEATRGLKSLPETVEIPVLVLTAAEKVEEMAQSLQAGAYGILLKPFDAETLVERIRHVLQDVPRIRAGDTSEQRAIQGILDNLSQPRTKAEILGVIFKSINQITPCQVLGLYLGASARPNRLLLAVQRPLSAAILDDLQNRITGISRRLLHEFSSPENQPPEVVFVAEQEGTAPFAGPLTSLIHAPFYIGNRVGGILSVASSAVNAYDEEDFKFVFSVGAELSSILTRVMELKPNGGKDMAMELDDYQRKCEKIKGRNIAFVSFKLGEEYHCKAEIDIPGAGARLATAKAKDRVSAVSDVRKKVEQLIRS